MQWSYFCSRLCQAQSLAIYESEKEYKTKTNVYFSDTTMSVYTSILYVNKL